MRKWGLGEGGRLGGGLVVVPGTMEVVSDAGLVASNEATRVNRV